jgi:hypothetical protein
VIARAGALALVAAAAIARADATPPPSKPPPSKPPPDVRIKEPERSADDPLFRPVVLEKPRGVIVSYRQAGHFFFQTDSRFTYYTPTREEVALLERKLPAMVRALKTVPPDFAKRLPGYTRQYVGLVDGKQRWIWVNFFCDDGGIDWVHQLVEVDDGGACFGQVQFEPATGKFRGFQLNGVG